MKNYWSTEGSVCSILNIKLQNGQLMFSHPHWRVELLGALTRLTVMGFLPTSELLLAYNVSSSIWPDRTISVAAPASRIFANFIMKCWKTLLKPFQNKKGQKNLRSPTKKRSFSLNFVGPSHFETALRNLIEHYLIVGLFLSLSWFI